jgi:multicomponent Na+:H+ antiporter subunit B
VSRRLRIALFGLSVGVLAPFLVWALSGLPDFGRFHGEIGDTLNRVVVHERHTSNVVTAVVFDYRGLDTMGEEFILFTAVIGVALLLRSFRPEKDERPRDRVSSEAVRLSGQLMTPVTFLLGLWLAAFGLVTPGGGFQGGVVLASALVLLWAAGSYRAYRQASPVWIVDLAEGLGAGGYVAIGLIALAVDGIFLHNLLGPGERGTLLSGGSMPFLNWASALEVAAANVLLFHEFFEEYVLALLGAVMCVLEADLKRVIAFLTVSHGGIFLVAIGLLRARGLAGANVYVVADGLAKGRSSSSSAPSRTGSEAATSCCRTAAGARAASCRRA